MKLKIEEKPVGQRFDSYKKAMFPKRVGNECQQGTTIRNPAKVPAVRSAWGISLTST